LELIVIDAREKEARWEDLVRHTKEKNYVAEQLDNKNDIKSR
jgi:hypothetical protein